MFMRLNYKIKPKLWFQFNSLKFIGFGILPPIIPILINICFNRTTFNLSNSILAILVAVMGCIFAYSTGSITVILNWLLLSLYLIFLRHIHEQHAPKSLLPISIWFLISLSLGAILPTISGEETRISLYGGEANFTGFYLLTFALAVYKANFKKFAYCILILTCLITLSRTAFVVSVFLFIGSLSGFRINWRSVKIITFTSIFLFIIISYLDVFGSTGYVYGLHRLYQFNDVSSMKRLDLILGWSSVLISDARYLLIGFPPEIIERIYNEHEIVVHNSFILKAVTCGSIYVAILVYIAYRILPIEAFLVMMLYCTMLHGLLGIPLIIFVRYLFGSSEPIFQKSHRNT